MALIVYPALVAETPPAMLHANFPDFPGMSLTAASPEELLVQSRERLGQRLQALEKAGEAWPAPSSLAQLRGGAAGAVIWVDVQVEDTPVRVTVSLGERLLARIDAAAEAHALTRSGYLAAAARRQLAAGGSPLESGASHRLSEEVAAAGRRIQETLGPDSPVGKTLAEFDAIAVDGLRRLAGGMSEAFTSRRKARPDAPPAPPETPADAAGSERREA